MRHAVTDIPPPRLQYTDFLADLRALLDELGIAASTRWTHGVRSPTQSAAQRTGNQPDSAASESPRRAVVGVVQDFIDEHVDETLTLERLSDEAHLSKYHFARVFREETGLTPWTYVQRARIRRAKELLDHDLPLSEVALRSGFYDQSHFTNVFKNVTGQTPGAYREKRKDLQEKDEQAS